MPCSDKSDGFTLILQVMESTLDKYLDLLYRMLLQDLDVFSQGWLYYWLLIPAVGYFVFFLLKWMVLTVPVWMPLAIAFRGPTHVKQRSKVVH